MIEKIGHYSLTNPATIYDEEALTALELAGRQGAKLNEVIDDQNKLRRDTETHLGNQDNAIEKVRTETVPADVRKEFQRNIDNGAFEAVMADHFGNLETRLNNLVENTPDGGTTMDAEVIDSRIGAFGAATAGNVGNSNRHQFATLRDMNLSLSQGVDTTEVPLLWECGGIHSGTGENVPDYEYSRTVGFIPYIEGAFAKLSPVDGVRVYLYKWENGVYSSYETDTASIDFVMSPGAQYRIVCANTDGTEISPEAAVSRARLFIENTVVSRKELYEVQAAINAKPLAITSNGLVHRETGKIYDPDVPAYGNTGMFPLIGYDRLEFYSFLNKGAAMVAFYDQYKQYLPDITIFSDTDNAEVLSGCINLDDVEYKHACYAIISCYDNNETFGFFQARLYRKDSLYENLTRWNKTINVMGDSITSTNYTRPTWWEIIAEETGARFNNYGISGTTLSHDASRHNQFGTCFVERVSEMDGNADMVVVMGGTNDNNAPRGSWTGGANSTFFGALDSLIKQLCTQYPGKPIVFCTPMQPSEAYSTNVANPVSTLFAKNETATLTPQERAAAIRLKCEQYSIPCLDLYNESGINGVQHIYYRPDDTLHPSAYGQQRLASLIKNKLKDFID